MVDTTVRDFLEGRRKLIKSSLDALTAANNKVYNNAEAHYANSQDEVCANRYIAQKVSGFSEAYGVNCTRIVVTSVLNRLEISSTRALEAGKNKANKKQQEIIDREWKRNVLDLEAPAIHESALVNGESYIIAWPDDMSEVSDDVAKSVAIHLNPATSTRIFYDLENPRKPEYAIKTWIDAEDYRRVILYFSDHIEHYSSETRDSSVLKSSVIDTTLNAAFSPHLLNTDDVESWYVENPWGIIPVFHFRTNGLVGRPEHLDSYGQQNSINKLLIIINVLAELYGWPQRYALAEAGSPTQTGMSPAEQAAAIAEGKTIDDVIEMSKEVGPATMLVLKGIKTLGEFSPANLQQLLDTVNGQIQLIALATDTPVHFFNTTGQIPSGAARRMAEQQFVSKVKFRQLSFGSTWEALWSFVLRAYGFSPEEIDVAVEWESAHSEDPVEKYELVTAKVNAGVPKKVALIEAGHDPKEVELWYPGDAVPEPTVIDTTTVEQ